MSWPLVFWILLQHFLEEMTVWTVWLWEAWDSRSPPPPQKKKTARYVLCLIGGTGKSNRLKTASFQVVCWIIKCRPFSRTNVSGKCKCHKSIYVAMSNIQLAAALSTYLAIVPIGVTTKDANWFGSNAKPFPCGKKCSTDQNSAPPWHGTTMHVGKPSIRVLSYASPEANSCRFFGVSDSKFATVFQNNKTSKDATYYRKIVSLKCADGFGK